MMNPELERFLIDQSGRGQVVYLGAEKGVSGIFALQRCGFGLGTTGGDLLDPLFDNGDFLILQRSEGQQGEQDRLDTLTEIDKQFWQNINSVRLAGAGNTNFVLVKDDIGNWYAKGLEADPASIIEGIRANALFALGIPLNANLLEVLEAQTAIEQAENTIDRRSAIDRLREVEDRNRRAVNTGGAGIDKSLGQALEQFSTDFAERSASDHASLDGALVAVSFHNSLRVAWTEAVNNTPNLDAEDRRDVCAVLQRLLRPDGANSVNATAPACVPEAQDFPEAFNTVCAPLEAAPPATGTPLEVAAALSQGVLRTLSALIDYRGGRLAALGGANLAGGLAAEIEAQKGMLRVAETQLGMIETQLNQQRNELASAQSERDTIKRLRQADLANIDCTNASTANVPEFTDACTKVSNAQMKVDSLVVRKTAAVTNIAGIKREIDALNARTAVRRRLVADLRGSFDNVVERVLNEHIGRRARANEDLERAVDVLTTASGVVTN